MLPRVQLINLASGVPLSIWYDCRDDGPDPKEPEHHFATVGLPQLESPDVLRIKPAYRAARTLTTNLADYQFIKRIAIGRDDDYAQLFSNDSKHIVACWTASDEARNIRLPAGNTNCRTRDHLGENEGTVSTHDGFLSITLNAAPRYLIFDREVKPLARLPSPPAFTCNLIRIPGGSFLATIDNPGGDPFSGNLHLKYNNTDASVPLTLIPATPSSAQSLPI